MTWQLGASAILLISLAGGFAWYERSRPDARIVALVATLAAFAALGRIAFAALPNVKPTTDIVLISGYALGAAPGFVVGALAGLSSNFFFGQGPWTPWQMAAWGGAGLIGAGLASLTGGRARRWPVALACGVVGFAFTVVQDAGDWVTYSDHSLGQLGVYIGKGVGFDAVHAAGCVAFAVAFGPALARSIGRFATRLQIDWQPVAPAVLAVAIAAAFGAQPARAASTPAAYLVAAQNADGGFGSAPGQPSTELFTGWAALGLAAGGIDPLHVVKDAHSVTRYLEAGTATDPGSIERTILALRAAGEPATSLVSALERDIGRDGSVAGQTNLTAFAILALRAAGISPPAATGRWLARQQDGDGGFNFLAAGGSSDVDDTASVLEATANREGAVRARAIRFIEAHQNRDGGFPSMPGDSSNAQSTAWAVQGLLAAGAAGAPVERAVGYLRSLTAADGHVRYSSTSDQTPVWVTAEAMMAIARKPLPLAAARTPAAPRTPVVAAPTDELTLAADVGVAAALVLAPIGLG